MDVCKVATRKIFMVLIVLALLFNLSGSVLATYINTGNPGSDWTTSASKEDVITMSRGDAYVWITGELTRISNECVSQLDSGASLDTTYIMTLYGTYLVYMNWVCCNISVYDGTNQWSIFDGPDDFDSVTSAELMNTAERLRAKIVEKGLLSSITDIESKLYNSSSVTSSMLPSYETMVQNGTLIGSDSYYTAFVNILMHYIDGNILVRLANYYNINASDRTQLTSELGYKFPSTWEEELNNGKVPTELATIAAEVKNDVLPYLRIYSQMRAAYQSSKARVLGNEIIVTSSREYNTTGYVSVKGIGLNIDGFVSRPTNLLYRYLFSAEKGGTTTDQDIIEDLDLSKGVLPFLANASIINDELVWGDVHDLKEIGYYVLAAGVVYDPFVSVAGNDLYISTLNQFMKNEEQKEAVATALQRAISYKKPIYVTDSGLDRWSSLESIDGLPLANYRLACLGDLLQINTAMVKAYAVAKGRLIPSEVDSSTWEYAYGGTNNNTSVDTKTSDIDMETVNTGSQLSTVGTKELLASGKTLSKPIAISAGANSIILMGRASSKVAAIGGLTSLIIHNASVDAKSNKYIKNANTQMLFLNGLGDIVLEDNTIVLPAISNPVLYNLSATAVADAESSPTGYYPYTATFCNNYPTARVAADSKAYVNNTGDEGKYLIERADGNMDAVRIYSVTANNEMRTAITDRVVVPVIASSSFSIGSDATEVYNLFKIRESNYNNWNHFVGYTLDRPEYQVFSSLANSQGISFFPLVEDNSDVHDSYIRIAAPLVTSAVRYISDSNSDDTGITSNGNFRVESYIEDFLCQGLLGTIYANTIVKSYQLDYDALVTGQYGRFTEFLKDITTSTLNTFGHVDGVLALKDGYENKFFNTIVSFLQRAYLIIAIILLLVIAVKFLKGHFNLIYVIFIAALVFSAFEVYTSWMPVGVPAVYNFFVNDVIEDVVWNTVIVQAEKYDETYKDASRKDATSGELRPYTATITLYKMTRGEREQLADKIGVDEEDINSGRTIYLDEQAGIFIKGDTIKMSLDKLLANNTMRGLYKTQWEELNEGVEELTLINDQINSNPYIVKLTKPYVSLESYYTPFCQIERAFLVNLNTFSNIFRIERGYNKYSDYMYKDCFLFNNFTNSGIFNAPGDDNVLRQNIQEDQILGSRTATAEDVIALCNEKFYPQEDWLNLRAVFANPSEAMRNSLWGQMMQKNGYYDNDWRMSEEQEIKLTKLILYINNHTKRFIYKNQRQLNSCSDENAIKLVSLYATMMFNQEVSEFGYWLYPTHINASDIELIDVLYGSMVSLEDRLKADDGDVVGAATLNLGAGGAIMVFLITILSALFIFILTYLVPVLYSMFGIVLIYKLANEEKGIGVVRGYTTVTIVSALLYLMYSFGLKLVKAFGYQWYGYLGTLLVTALCIYFLFHVIMSVVFNPLEMGDTTLAKNLMSSIDKLAKGGISRLVSKQVSLRTNNWYSDGNNPIFRGYSRRGSIDDYRTSNRPRRGYQRNAAYGYNDGPVGPDYSKSTYSRYGRNSGYDDISEGNLGRDKPEIKFKKTTFLSRLKPRRGSQSEDGGAMNADIEQL